MIDDENKRSEIAHKTFTIHDTSEFQKALSDVIEKSYHELFSLHGENAWTLDQSRLISFFRQSDQSTERVGKEQARTFQTLASYAGHGEPVAPSKPRVTKADKPRPAKKVTQNVAATVTPKEENQESPKVPDRNFGLTVRIEINLPVASDQETYDRIFKSIRENLLDE